MLEEILQYMIYSFRSLNFSFGLFALYLVKNICSFLCRNMINFKEKLIDNQKNSLNDYLELFGDFFKSVFSYANFSKFDPPNVALHSCEIKQD